MNTKHRRLIALLVLTLGSGIAILDGTIVTLALPRIAADLGGGLSAQQWIVDGYMLSLASLVLIAGSLGDIFGRKKLYLLGVAGFGVSSLLCAFAPSSELLIAARVLQGIFAALMTPGALAMITATFPKKEQSPAIGHWTAWSSIAVLLAPVIGGGILALASWRWIFLVNVPLALICLFVGARVLEESKDDAQKTVDYRGAFLVWLSLAALTLGLIEGPAAHWPLWSLASLAVGFAALVAFIFWERKAPAPMVPLSLFHSRNFSGANIATFLLYGALGGYSFALTLYLQNVLHYPALLAGLMMLPASILMLLFAGRVGKLAARYGSRLFMTLGPIISGIGIALLFPLAPGANLWLQVLPYTMLFGVGLVLTVAPLTATVMASAASRFAGVASGINNAVARTASLIVVAILGFAGSGVSMYHFAMIACALLAIGAGMLSFLMITNNKAKGSV